MQLTIAMAGTFYVFTYSSKEVAHGSGLILLSGTVSVVIAQLLPGDTNWLV